MHAAQDHFPSSTLPVAPQAAGTHNLALLKGICVSRERTEKGVRSQVGRRVGRESESGRTRLDAVMPNLVIMIPSFERPLGKWVTCHVTHVFICLYVVHPHVIPSVCTLLAEGRSSDQNKTSCAWQSHMSCVTVWVFHKQGRALCVTSDAIWS